jgi:hypothetical protein
MTTVAGSYLKFLEDKLGNLTEATAPRKNRIPARLTPKRALSTKKLGKEEDPWSEYDRWERSVRDKRQQGYYARTRGVSPGEVPVATGRRGASSAELPPRERGRPGAPGPTGATGPGTGWRAGTERRPREERQAPYRGRFGGQEPGPEYDYSKTSAARGAQAAAGAAAGAVGAAGRAGSQFYGRGKGRLGDIERERREAPPRPRETRAETRERVTSRYARKGVFGPKRIPRYLARDIDDLKREVGPAYSAEVERMAREEEDTIQRWRSGEDRDIKQAKKSIARGFKYSKRRGRVRGLAGAGREVLGTIPRAWVRYRDLRDQERRLGRDRRDAEKRQLDDRKRKVERDIDTYRAAYMNKIRRSIASLKSGDNVEESYVSSAISFYETILEATDIQQRIKNREKVERRRQRRMGIDPDTGEMLAQEARKPKKRSDKEKTKKKTSRINPISARQGKLSRQMRRIKGKMGEAEEQESNVVQRKPIKTAASQEAARKERESTKPPTVVRKASDQSAIQKAASRQHSTATRPPTTVKPSTSKEMPDAAKTSPTHADRAEQARQSAHRAIEQAKMGQMDVKSKLQKLGSVPVRAGRAVARATGADELARVPRQVHSAAKQQFVHKFLLR